MLLAFWATNLSLIRKTCFSWLDSGGSIWEALKGLCYRIFFIVIIPAVIFLLPEDLSGLKITSIYIATISFNALYVLFTFDKRKQKLSKEEFRKELLSDIINQKEKILQILEEVNKNDDRYQQIQDIVLKIKRIDYSDLRD